MKWITKIALRNYRAFGEGVPPIEIPHGHHLLIYGENGSGKSSLYGAVRDFFSSTTLPVNPAFPFEENRFATSATHFDVAVDVHDDATGTTSPYLFARLPSPSNHQVPEIQLANKVKGFLDYKRMLRVHALDVPRSEPPNVFGIILWELLAEYSLPDPYGTGVATSAIKEIWDKLHDDLCNNDRRSRVFQNAEVALGRFNTDIEALLTRIFAKANEYLGPAYFATNIVCNPGIVPVAVIQEPFQKKYLSEELYLGVHYGGQPLADYHYFLNEARLSAVALSIHLAALKLNAVAPDTLKVLYLDDVFIGMDTSNRLPLLRILETEFIRPQTPAGIPDVPTQVVISTYDRHWYEVVQRHFEGRSIGCAKYELYRIADGAGFDRPLILPFANHLDKAIGHLRSTTKLDYPAAANALRKYAEALVQDFLPNHEVRDQVFNATIPEHKLGKYVDIAIRLYQQFGWNVDLLNRLKNALPTLLHPLSHYELSSPVYKGELEDAVQILVALQTRFETDKRLFRMAVPPRTLIVEFQLNATDVDKCEVSIEQPIYAVRDNNGAISVIQQGCTHKKTYAIRAGVKHPYVVRTNYTELANAYHSILAGINAQAGQVAIPPAANVLGCVDT